MNDIDSEFSELSSYLESNWQKVLMLCFLIAAGAWFFGEYQETMEARKGEASSAISLALNSAREASLELRKDPAKKEALEKRDLAISNLDRVVKDYSDSIYSSLAKLIKRGMLVEGGQLLDEPSISVHSTSIESNSKTSGEALMSILSEVNSLIEARSKLENSDPTLQENGLIDLKQLITSSKFVTVEAISSLLALKSDQGTVTFIEGILSSKADKAEEIKSLLAEQGFYLP